MEGACRTGAVGGQPGAVHHRGVGCVLEHDVGHLQIRVEPCRLTLPADEVRSHLSQLGPFALYSPPVR